MPHKHSQKGSHEAEFTSRNGGKWRPFNSNEPKEIDDGASERQKDLSSQASPATEVRAVGSLGRPPMVAITVAGKSRLPWEQRSE